MVWADTAEKLKEELTDKYVVVMDGVPELKRFAGRTGTVKTVNMSGRALVQFEASTNSNYVDISWYDIDPSYLTVIDAPLPKKQAVAAAEKPESKPAAKAPAAKAKGGMSPLELARQQGAAGAAAAKPAPAADGGKKLSPLEQARQQGAAKSEGEAAAKPQAAKPQGGQKLSPLEMARMQGAAKSNADPAPASEPETPAAEQAPAEEVSAESPPSAAAESKPASPAADTSGMSKIELARMQGAFKG